MTGQDSPMSVSADPKVYIDREALSKVDFKRQYHLEAYSTDIASAWEVVERMRAQGFEVDMGFAKSFGWWTLFYNHDDKLAYRGESEDFADATTAPPLALAGGGTK